MAPLRFTTSQINHHSFLRWNGESETIKKEDKMDVLHFNPRSFEKDSIERSLMITAFSA